jgi:glycosyltransferase involved in cell wall biosynthesis
VARCEDWKRPEVFIELARRCEGEKFVMIMPRSSSQPEYYSRIEELARAVPNLQHIEFVPFLGIDEYFRRAKVFVQTSRQEGFPNTFVQAARNGAAIVSLEVNPDGFLERHACGACAGGSFERLVEQVQELLGDARERERQGSNAWRYARAHHDIGPIVERYKMMFRGLVDGGGSRS